MSLRNLPTALKTGLVFGFLAAFSMPAAAQKEVMKTCGAEWQKVKERNKGEAPKGMTWKKFLSDCRERHSKADAKPAPKKAKAKKTGKKKSTKTAASPQDVMKTCGAEWQKVKERNKGEAPRGVTWQKFLSDCRKRYAAADAKPKAKKPAAKKKTAAKKTAPSSPQNVMKTCGAEWQRVKERNKGEAPRGVTWNSFLSDCRKRYARSDAAPAAKKTRAKKAAAAPASPQDVMKTCGAEWQRVKERNKGEAPRGVTWQKFLSDCRKRQSDGRTVAVRGTPAKKKKSKTKAAASGDSMMSACGAEWRTLKEKNKVPKGMTWTKYLGECADRYAGKFKPTPAQLAMYGRIKKCGAMWRDAKERGTAQKRCHLAGLLE